MICKKCDTPNDDDAKYCMHCGADLEEQKSQKVKKKNKTLIGVIVAMAVILIAVVIAVILVMHSNDVKKQEEYKQYISQGDKYLEDLDYDKAEDAYLSAINLDPKQEDPYLALADLYLTQEEYDKAIEILKKAEKNTGGNGGSSSKVKEKKEETEKIIEDIKNAEKYSWVVQPEIEADEIYYLSGYNSKDVCKNTECKQMISDYAVIRKGDTYGLINSDGKWYKDLECTNITTVIGYYELQTKETMYSAELDTDTNDFVLYENDELRSDVAMVGDIYGAQGEYYYCGSMHNWMETCMTPLRWELNPLEEAAPVQEMTAVYTEDDGDPSVWLEENGKKYAVWKDNKAVTEFEYDECGSLESGLLAAKKDGKWGYIDESGKTVIPFEYDVSWKHYASPYPDTDMGEYCYAATEGYVPLVKDGKWEMRNTENKIVIPSGTFEEILPVHNGRCWVKKDGKWGVIEFEKAVKDSEDDKDNEDPTEEDTDKNETSDSNADALIQKITRTWTNEGNVWNNTYTTTFNADGSVTSEGWRNKDTGIYEVTGPTTIKATFNSNQVDSPGTGWESIDGYTYSVTYEYDAGSNTLYATYDDTFKSGYMSNASDGYLH